MKPAEQKVLREEFYNAIETLDLSAFEVIGRSTEGLVFQDNGGQCVVVKAIVKKEDFDYNDAIAEHAEKEEKARLALEAKEAKIAKVLAEKAKKEAEKAKKDEFITEKEAKVDEKETKAE